MNAKPKKKRDRKAYMKLFRSRHKERLNAYWKQWKIDNGYDIKAYHRRWYLKNREKRIAQTKAYQEKNAEKYKALNKAYDSRPERRAARKVTTEIWRRNNPQKVKAMAMRRVAKRIGAVTDKSADGMIVRWRSCKSFTCYYCQRRHPRSQLNIDHIVPLANNGSHTSDNLCASCVECNSKKHTTSVSHLKFIPQTLLPL